MENETEETENETELEKLGRRIDATLATMAEEWTKAAKGNARLLESRQF